MTAEMNKLANDPKFLVEFAVGDPSPDLKPQSRRSGIQISGVYFESVKRYLLKSAHMSMDDLRIFDVDTGQVIFVSHHPGKNPYEMLDPLGMANTDAWFNVAGGEWESLCDVSAMESPFVSFKVRPKLLSRHGRQNIKVNDETVLNIAKMSKLKTKSLRDHFMVGKGGDSDAEYKCTADMLGRSISIANADGDIVAQVAKTKKALLLTAAFGSGSESTIDIAPGVDCSTILAIIFGLKQVGKHYMNDAMGNYVKDPLTDAVTGSVADAATSAIGGDGDGEEGGDEAPEEAEPEEPEEPEEESEESEYEEDGGGDEGEEEGGGFGEVAAGLFSAFFGEGEEE